MTARLQAIDPEQTYNNHDATADDASSDALATLERCLWLRTYRRLYRRYKATAPA